MIKRSLSTASAAMRRTIFSISILFLIVTVSSFPFSNKFHEKPTKVSSRLLSTNADGSDNAISRRTVLQKSSVTLTGGAVAAFVDPKLAASVDFEVGLLESRVTEDLMSRVPYTIESQDIFYPEFFRGVWDVSSVTTNVEAPCGIALFGGNATYDAAMAEVGPQSELNYRARFVPSSIEDKVIADREFNVIELSKSSMGPNAVVDVPEATPNKFCAILAPNGANNLFTVDLLAVARRSENVNRERFDCAELVRQIVSIKGSQGAQQKPRIKDIETISLYEISKVDSDGMVKEIKCKQRIASFVAPIQEDPISMKLWQYSRGRPVDTRFYDGECIYMYINGFVAFINS